MSNKINLPLDSAAYLRKARLLFREGKNEEALELIEKVYEIDKDIQINVFYAFMLSQFARYKEALEIMNQKKTIYINNQTHVSFYTEMLVKTHKFIEAEYLIQKYMNDPTRTDEHTWENLGQDLLEERKRVNLQIIARREGIKKSLRELEQYSHMVQVRKIRDAGLLDLSDLQKVAQKILVSAEISGTVQRYFLELLINKSDRNVYSFHWFNEIKEVCPEKLPRFADIELVREVSEAMEEKLAKYPDLEIRVKIEMMHDLLLLYPYIEETIKDVDFWVDVYISELDFFNHVKVKRMVVTAEEQEMMKWINYLNTIAQRGQMFTD